MKINLKRCTLSLLQMIDDKRVTLTADDLEFLTMIRQAAEAAPDTLLEVNA